MCSLDISCLCICLSDITLVWVPPLFMIEKCHLLWMPQTKSLNINSDNTATCLIYFTVDFSHKSFSKISSTAQPPPYPYRLFMSQETITPLRIVSGKKTMLTTIYPLQFTSLEFKCDYMASTPPISVHEDRYW